MSQRARVFAVTMVAFTLICPRANASLLDRIFSAAEAARDRAADARDRAREARDTANEIRDRVRDGIVNLTGQVRQAITQATTDIKRDISDAFSAQAQFTSQECVQFRAQLIQFLTDLKSVSEAMEELMTPGCLNVPQKDIFGPLISLVERIPCALLYPAYSGLPDLCIFQSLRADVEALRKIKEILGSLDGLNEPAEGALTPEELLNPEQLFSARLSSLRVYLEKRTLLVAYINGLRKSSVTLQWVGKKLQANAERIPKIAGTMGLHGYALVRIEAKPIKAMGEVIESIGFAQGEIVKFVQGKLDAAAALSAISVVLTKVEQFQQEQSGDSFMGASALELCGLLQMSSMTVLAIGFVRLRRDLRVHRGAVQVAAGPDCTNQVPDQSCLG